MCGDQTIHIRPAVLYGPRSFKSEITTGPPILRYCATHETAEYNLSCVLQVSRAFSVEALRNIYKTSLFCFEDADTLRNFVDRVPEQSLRIVSNLRIHLIIRTGTLNLLTFQLIRSCILGSLPSLSHLHMTIRLAKNFSLCESRTVCTIEERLQSSTILPQLKCAMLRLTTWSHPDMEEAITGSAAMNDFDLVRHLVTGQVE